MRYAQAVGEVCRSFTVSLQRHFQGSFGLEGQIHRRERTCQAGRPKANLGDAELFGLARTSAESMQVD